MSNLKHGVQPWSSISNSFEVQRRMISVVIFSYFLDYYFCFFVGICDLVHAVEAMYGLP